MGDKLANVLIVFMMIVILGLGGMYYVKAIGGGNNISSANSAELQEKIQINMQNTDLRQNTASIGTEENKPIIGNVQTSNTNVISTNIYSQNISSSNNRYYYNQLSEYAKIIYDTIVKNVNKLKNGNERIDIEYDFSNVWNNGNGEEDLKQYYDDAVNAVNLDCSDLFYIEFSKMWLNIEKVSNFFSTKYTLYINAGNYDNYYADGFNSRQDVETAISQVEIIKNQILEQSTGTNYFKVKKVHDWLIDNMEYDASTKYKSSIYGALVQRRGVCESYARAYKYILDDMGIENVLVTGTATNSSGATEDHMWNYVKLDGEWYAVDVTWDDPVIIGGGRITDSIRYRYFLIGSKEFYTNHTERLTISQTGRTFSLPKLSMNKH